MQQPFEGRGEFEDMTLEGSIFPLARDTLPAESCRDLGS